jgi:hypothetical protein
MTTGHKTAIRGFRFDKLGNLVRDQRRPSVSALIRRRKSKRVRVVVRSIKETNGDREMR